MPERPFSGALQNIQICTPAEKWCHDIQHNDTWHNDIQHNDTWHNNIQRNDTQHKGLLATLSA